MSPSSSVCRSRPIGLETTARTYQRLRDLAATALDAGQSVIVDAVHLRPEERAAINEVASRSKARFTGLWLEAPVDRLMQRVAERKLDASDATAEIVSAQARRPIGAMDWRRVDASAPMEDIARGVLAAL